MFAADAIVVGAGPAGSVAALALARRGWAVRLVDSAGIGRPKCCGHCLHPRAGPLLEALGVAEELEKRSDGATLRGQLWLIDGDSATRIADSHFDAGGVVVGREVLDSVLLRAAERAGVAVQLETPARWRDGRLELDGHGVDAGLVVAADGLGSGLARANGLAAPPNGRRFGLAVDVFDPPDSPWRRGVVAMLVARDGYLGVVGHGDRLHLAACARTGGSLPTRPIELLAWFADRSAPLAEALGADWCKRAGPVIAAGPMPWATVARTTDRLALVGDAAGYVEPFTGEGMLWAIESALALAQSVRQPGGWGLADRERYERLWRTLFGRAHRRCAWVAGLIRRPRLLRLVGSAAAVWPTATERIRRRLVPR